jgi:hypothetical protein
MKSLTLFVAFLLLAASSVMAQHEPSFDPEPVSDAEGHTAVTSQWSFASRGGWTQITDYPGIMNGLYGGSVYYVLNDTPYVYVFGGFNNAGLGGGQDVWVWNTISQQWIQKADMPGPRFYHTAAAASGKIYIISGAGAAGSGTPVDSTLEYDPATDTYTTMAPIPAAVNWAGAGVYDDGTTILIYVTGGSTAGTGTFVNTSYLFDPLANFWLPLTNAGDVYSVRRSHSCSVVNGPDSSFLVVAAGFGTAPSFKRDVFEAKIDLGDPTTLNWVQVPDLPITGTPGGTFNGTSRTAGATYDRYHLVIGGQLSFTPADTVYLYSNQIWGWNTVAKTWERFANKNFFSSNMIFNAYSPSGEVWQITAYGSPDGSPGTAAVGSFNSEWTNEVVTSIGDQIANRPATFTLGQNFPNPFNPSTTVRFSLPEAAHVTVKVFNVIGQEVATLVDGRREIGTHETVWNGKSTSGAEVGTGVYFYKMEARTSQATYSTLKKMVLLK